MENEVPGVPPPQPKNICSWQWRCAIT